MNAYSIAEQSSTELAVQSAIATQAKPQILSQPGKGLTIVDSARRDLEATLQLLADRAQYITGAAGAAIALRDGGQVLCRASSGSAAPELGAYLDLSAGLSGECVRTRAALRCDDVATDARVDRNSCQRLGIASFAVMPILRKQEAVGIFAIFAGKPRAFQERDLAALERLCEIVNIALDQAIPEPAKAVAFAVHGVKVKAMAAGVGAEASIALCPTQAADEHTGFIAGLPAVQASEQKVSKPLDRIRACASCGFPVSEGRALCVDCEEKGIQSSDAGFLSGIGRGPAQRGIKSWIITNRYVIGMILISAATIAFAFLR